MRPLTSHFPDQALTTLDTLLKQTKEVLFDLIKFVFATQ